MIRMIPMKILLFITVCVFLAVVTGMPAAAGEEISEVRKTTETEENAAEKKGTPEAEEGTAEKKKTPEAEEDTAEKKKTPEAEEDTAKKKKTSEAEEDTAEKKKTSETEGNAASFKQRYDSLLAAKTVKTKGSSKKVITIGEAECDDGLMRALKTEIKRIRSLGYNLGFVMADIRTGNGVSFNPGHKFYSASSIKGPYVAAMVSAYPETLDYEYYTIESILTYSDNEGYADLWYTYGPDCLLSWAKQAGIKKVQWDLYTDYSPRDLAKLWLMNYVFFETDPNGKKLSGMYEHPQTSRIRGVLGRKYRTLSKAGWIPEGWEDPTFNDAGIVYAGDRPYVVAFLSEIPEEKMYLADRILMLLDRIHQKSTETDFLALEKAAASLPGKIAASV